MDNCYPGLEFDQRTLDTAFFPGLSLEFHRPEGAILAAVGPTGPGAEQGLLDADLPLYLWALCGRITVDQDEASAPTFTCTGQNGLDVWRRVHDLLPGTIAVLLGPVPGISSRAPIRSAARSTDSGSRGAASCSAMTVAPCRPQCWWPTAPATSTRTASSTRTSTCRAS